MSKGKVTKFVSISPDKRYLFEQMYETTETIVPAELYVDKTTGRIYFLEQERRPFNGIYEIKDSDVNLSVVDIGFNIEDDCKAINNLGL